MVKIVADSTCNLAPDVLKRYDIRVAPITIHFGSDSYEEGIDIDRDLFDRKIDELNMIPTTSQPLPPGSSASTASCTSKATAS